MKLFIVGCWKPTEDGSEWGHEEFQGVFDSHDKALAICDYEGHVIYAHTLNENIGFDSVERPREDYYFPFTEGMPDAFRSKWIDAD